jgi:hypothetical protein
MVIFVPRGSADEPTNAAHEFDATAEFLRNCGVLSLNETIETTRPRDTLATSLFS